MIDRTQALKAFKEFLTSYDSQNPKIRLKIVHTYHVADLSEAIASSLGLSQEDIDLAWLCGLVHDLGRFEQIRRYDSFLDAKTVDHARLSQELLFGPNLLIRDFVTEADCDDLISTAIAHHSDFRLPEGMDSRTLLFSQILRDADKIDILRVNVCDPVETIYGVSEAQMQESPVSQEALEGFYQHRTLQREQRRYPADFVIGHCCFIFELVYPRSLELALEQGYIFTMLEHPFTNKMTADQFKAMKTHLLTWLSEIGAK